MEHRIDPVRGPRLPEPAGPVARIPGRLPEERPVPEAKRRPRKRKPAAKPADGRGGRIDTRA